MGSECCGKCVPSTQRGGALAVRGWLVALLLGAAVTSAAMNWYQYRHRTVQLNITITPPAPTTARGGVLNISDGREAG